MAWEENPRICLHMQLIAILSRIGVVDCLPTNCKWEIKGGTIIDAVMFTADGTMNPVVLTAYDQDGNKIQERKLNVSIN